MNKRILFTLLFSQGNFIQSRNFKRQAVGDVDWLISRFRLFEVLQYVDELVILNLDREITADFRGMVEKIVYGISCPLTLGGGLIAENHCRTMFDLGADRVSINSALVDIDFLKRISSVFGGQAILAWLDYRWLNSQPTVFFESGTVSGPSVVDFVRRLSGIVGEFLVHSIDRDGTGFGLDFCLLDYLRSSSLFNQTTPLIVSGGLGQGIHAYDAFERDYVNAVSTSNILNFIGSSFGIMRDDLLNKGVDLPHWREVV